MTEKIIVPVKILDDKSPNCLRYMVDNLIKENMALRRDGTILKLVMSQIIEDLEEAGNNQRYINWIEENCNLEFYSNVDIDELNDINRKRKYGFLHNQSILKEMYNKAGHSYEMDTILRIAKKFGYEWW